mmetsp:Transcript_19858/g.57587  ORF Transcript_19858/g.57587 Transcript_19858/m.57587 type:complete len:300 (-) Transcript_19858:322-1221(-)
MSIALTSEGWVDSRQEPRIRSYQHHPGPVRFAPDFHLYQQENGPPCKCLLTTMIVIGVFVVLFTTNPLGEWTPETQIMLLNSLTEKAGSVVPSRCNSTLVLMRHCEKAGLNEELAWETQDSMGNRHCSVVGFQRAKYIPTLFGDEPGSIWPLPDHLYAMGRGRPGVKHLNYREIETITPLEEKSGVEIDTHFSVGGEKELAKDVFKRLASGELCEQVIVVNWKHSRIPTMAAAVGCGIDEGCPEKYHKHEFDEVWQIKFSYGSEGGIRRMKNNIYKPTSKQWRVEGSVVKEGFVSQESP